MTEHHSENIININQNQKQQRHQVCRFVLSQDCSNVLHTGRPSHPLSTTPPLYHPNLFPLISDHPLLLPPRPSSYLERRVITEPSSAVVTSCMSLLLFLIITRERGHSTRKLIFHPRSIKTQSAARKQSEAERLLYSFNI